MTTEPPTLTAFLLARIEEDEAMARAASPGPWRVNDESDAVLAVDDVEVCDGFALSGPQTRATTAHIARHDPARVLAECKAHRAIVEGHHGLHVCPNLIDDGYTDYSATGIADGYRPCPTVLALASIYADHPDFRKEWAL